MRIDFQRCAICSSEKLIDIVHANCANHKLWMPEIGDTIIWRQCENCGHIQTSGYFDDETSNKVLANVCESQVPGCSFEADRMVWAHVVDRVAKIQSQGKWIDVGAGSGNLLLTAKEYGFESVGSDLRQDTVDGLVKLGIPSYLSLTDEIANNAAVISIADCLEHVIDPLALLERAYGWLRDGGILFLSMPNCESPVWSIASERGDNPYWGEIEHYHNFSKSEMFKILEYVGFKNPEYSISRRYRFGMEIIAQK